MFARTRAAGRKFFHVPGTSNVAAILAGVLGLVFIAHSAFAETRVFLDSSGNKSVVDTTAPPAWASIKAPPTKQLTATSILFNVTYQDLGTGSGFYDPVLGQARRDTVDLAIEYIDSILNESGTCDIVFLESLNSGTGGPLATAGTFFAVTPGFTNGDAFEHITTGVDPSPGTADIFVTVDFGYPWNTGTSSPSPGQFDLLSVLTHELTHGLGFLSLSTSTGTSEIASGVFSFWDRELETGNGRDLWDDATAAFLGIPPDLTGNDNGVVFVGTNATVNYGSTPPVYAPPTFNSGSSLSHWDPAVPGRAIMEPSTLPGVTFREYLIVEIGALSDIGYANAAQPSELPDADFSSSLYSANEQDGTATITVRLSAAPGAGNTAHVDYATSNGSAKQGTDYTATTGTLTFGATETERTFNVAIINDADPEITETLYLTLSNPVDAALAGDNNPATLRIFDDDPGLNSFVVPFFRQKRPRR
jgi:hypothetical protein